MFRGLRPSSQPRSLRSVSEEKGTTPSGFVEESYDSNAGMPGPAGMSGVYQDTALSYPVASTDRITVADKLPFNNVRRG